MFGSTVFHPTPVDENEDDSEEEVINVDLGSLTLSDSGHPSETPEL